MNRQTMRPSAASRSWHKRILAAAIVAMAGSALTFGQEPESPAATPGPVFSHEHATGGWFGVREKMAEHGVIVELNLIADYSVNFDGGLHTGDAFRHLLSVGVHLQTERLIGWEGGAFFIGFQTFNGHNGSERLVGDVQGFDNIDADGFTQISELWYEQVLLGETLRIKVGKVEANSEFAFVEYGGEFLNSSPGFSPTILGFPSYPDQATSVNAFVYPCEWFYAGAGVYDGATQDGGYGRTGNRGPSTFFGDPADLFLIGEAGLKWGHGDGERPGRLGLGVWQHTGSFDRLDGGTESGTTGFYAVFDQMLWRENGEDEQGVGLFAQYGWADPDLSEINHHIGLGFAWAGAIPGRDDDVLGLMGSYVDLSGDAGFSERYELAIELFYKIQSMQWLSLKPDLQYIINPGGEADDALVGTLRLEVTF